jgi:phosphate transport system permease protein
MEAASLPSGGRAALERPPLARLPDRALKYGLTALALAILALIVYFFVRLLGEARPAFGRAGVFGFAFNNDWNVNAERFGALPLVVGTLITSALALLIGVPVAVAAAIYATELCPRRLRPPLTLPPRPRLRPTPPSLAPTPPRRTFRPSTAWATSGRKVRGSPRLS